MGQTCAQIARFGGSRLERSAHPICLDRIRERFDRSDSVITVLSTVTCRMQFIFPSQNFRALDADDSRQFVTVMFSQGSGGP